MKHNWESIPLPVFFPAGSISFSQFDNRVHQPSTSRRPPMNFRADGLLRVPDFFRHHTKILI